MPVAAELSGQERKVVKLVAEGLRNKAVASRLGISVRTVEQHRRHSMDKLRVRGLVQLTKSALRLGLTGLD